MTAATLSAFVVALALVDPAAPAGTNPRPETLDGWARYAAAVERRRAAEVTSADRFLAMDFDASGAADRRAVMAGELVVRQRDAADATGEDIDIPHGMVHHWRGAIFLPGVTVDRLLARLEAEPPPLSAEVLRASQTRRGDGALAVYLRLQRKKIVTAVYDTDHDVRFVRYTSGRAGNTSVATRIVELEHPGTPLERQKAAGEDRGFLWRLNAYWRYQAVPGGVIAECESISLSRDVPFGLGLVAGPIVSSTARESMERTLESLRAMITG